MSCCLQRLQIFRDVFARVIASFTVYAPVLVQIQDEYERVIRELRSQCLQIPKLHAELQTLQTQCLHEISAHNAETKLRVQALRSQLKATQAKLGASAAQHARDNEQLAALRTQIETLEIRSDVVQRSNNSLVNGIKRHDDTLRHVHDRAREDTMAPQQVTNKYHHACDEIAELKKTIASLEEKVGGVHVTADKATIAMLTRELQDAHASLQHALKTEANASMMTQLLQQLAHQTALNHIFVRVLDEMGVHVTFNELMTMLRKSTTATANLVSEQVPAATSTSAASATLSEYAEASEQLTRWVITQLQTSSGSPVASGHGATFLTEPEEQHDLVHAPRLLVPKAADDFFPGRGLGDDVPEYLRCDGVVRNLWYPQRKLETILARVWQQKDELEKAKRVHFGVRTTRSSSSNNHSVPLARVFWMMLNRMCSSKADAIEAAYNILAALERFSAKSSDSPKTCGRIKSESSTQYTTRSQVSTRSVMRLVEVVVADAIRYFPWYQVGSRWPT
uniref:Translin-associated factor X-interacting protein 1 N-terminal domain-containing protein n=1 Tax=Globisporangium ultimum (strain ATCC 200006 / CBS 805.95 / DAOM BR144) TaxID=431595 RepID=K3W6A3_GLOUD